jgi:Cdc6-like AAA superfamily ATPase
VQLQSTLTPEMQESMGPALEEVQQAMAAMRLSATAAGDAREALELSARLVEQAAEDQARSTEHIRRAYELLGIEV